MQKLIDRWRQQAANLLLDAEAAEAKAGGAERTFQRFETIQARIKECKRSRNSVLTQALAQRSSDAAALLVRIQLVCLRLLQHAALERVGRPGMPENSDHVMVGQGQGAALVSAADTRSCALS